MVARARREFKINGTINAKVDARSKITPEETEAIQDRLEAGESTSEVAEDYPVSESRVSQLKKEPRKSKTYKIRKQKTLAQMPISLIRRWLVARFKANNPLADSQEIDFDAHITIHDFDFYHDLVDHFAKIFPDFEWYYSYEKDRIGVDHHGFPFEWVYEKSVDIRLKLYWSGEGKYAQVKGTIPKKSLEYVRDRLYEELTIEWPLTEIKRSEERPVLVMRNYQKWRKGHRCNSVNPRRKMRR